MTRMLHKKAHRKTDYCDQKQYRQQKKKKLPESKNGKKNNSMDSSSDKQEKTWTWLRKKKP